MKIQILTTGGTLFQKFSKEDGQMQISLTGEEVYHRIFAGQPSGKQDDLQISILKVSERSGAYLTFDTMLKIRDVVVENERNKVYDGFLLLTGTDAMDEAAFALDLLCASSVPFVVTGAMLPADIEGYDGFNNIKESIMVLKSMKEEAPSLVSSLLVVMNNDIHAAQYVYKKDSQLIGAFSSAAAGVLGQIRSGKVVWYYKSITPAKKYLSVEYSSNFPTKIPIWTMCVDAHFSDSMMEGLDGLIIAGMGTSSLSPSVIEQLSPKWTSKIPIVLVSRCSTGLNVDDYLYRGSIEKYTSRGFKIEGYEQLNPWQARIKLILELATQKTKNINNPKTDVVANSVNNNNNSSVLKELSTHEVEQEISNIASLSSTQQLMNGVLTDIIHDYAAPDVDGEVIVKMQDINDISTFASILSWEEQDTPLSQKKSSLACLPEGILIYIFSYLPTGSVGKVEQVCKLWRRLASNCVSGVSLDFSNQVKPDDQLLFQYLSSTAYITSLNLSTCSQLTINCLAYLKKYTPKLTYLNLNSCKWFNDKCCQALAKAALSNLEHLELSHCNNVSDFGLNTIVTTAPKLKVLNIAACARLTDRAIETLSQRCTQLIRLDCSQILQNITESTLTSLATFATSLQALTISIKKNVNSKAYLKAPPHPSLKSLNLTYCLVHLPLFKQLTVRYPNLETMTISNCHGVNEEKVTLIEQHPKIRNIHVTTCLAQVKPTQIRFPDVHVVNGHDESRDRTAAWKSVTTKSPVKYDNQNVNVELYF